MGPRLKIGGHWKEAVPLVFDIDQWYILAGRICY